MAKPKLIQQLSLSSHCSAILLPRVIERGLMKKHVVHVHLFTVPSRLEIPTHRAVSQRFGPHHSVCCAADIIVEGLPCVVSSQFEFVKLSRFIGYYDYHFAFLCVYPQLVPIRHTSM